MSPEELLELDLVEAGDRLRRGEVDAAALTDQYLAQIERTEATLNAYVTVDVQGARAAAAQAAQEIASGLYRGPLHGIPLGVKDLIDTAGLTTTYGSALFREHVPSQDAHVVAELRRCGAVILGKHATHEFAWGGRTDGAAYGPTHNPHDPGRIPGGSSGGGGASVAAHSSIASIGTDTAGSVRIPAALSGCVGLKPTHDWMLRTGVHPLAPSLDVIGLLTRSVRDARVLHRTLRGGHPGSVAAAVDTVAFVDDPTETIDPAVSAGVAWALQRLRDEGVRVERVRLPPVGERAVALLTWVRAEAEQVHRASFAASHEQYGTDLASLLELGPVPDAELRAAQAVVRLSVRAMHDALRDHAVLVGATVPVPAPLIGELEITYDDVVTPIEFVLTRLTSIANAAGLPALSVPAQSSGLPVGIQLIGRPQGEEDLLALAEIFEQSG